MTTEQMTTDELRLNVLASPAAVGVVRDCFERCLMRWEVAAPLRDDVILAASELLTNAVEAAPSREVHARLSRDDCGVLLEIWDPSNAMPRPEPVVELTLRDLDLTEERFDANGGWGLPLVAALAAGYGCRPYPPNGGKTIWARFGAAASRASAPAPRRP
ncbi:ATP-binding protein [Actinomadura scrupuli]|uniref:ATP-binding protein n=1 Tax=Actinomadura scrupuli TaxID=559629 RepID=UPI003D96A538